MTLRGTKGTWGGVSNGGTTQRGTSDAPGPRPGKPEVLVAPPEVLEHGLCSAVRTAKAADPLRPVIVVVPGDVVAAHVPRVLARGLGAATAVEVFTYDELVTTLARARPGRRARGELSSAQARVLARVVTARAKGWFEPLAGTPGFADAFADFLADLRGARVSPEALTRAGLPIEIRRKLSSLATCAREFEDRRGGRRTREDRLEDATVVLERTMRGVAVILYGISVGTDADARLIERVCHATSATVLLPALRAPAAAAFTPTLELVRHCGAEPPAHPPEPAVAADPTALTHLQRHLFRLPDEAAPDDTTVRLVTAENAAAEAREVAAACTRWAREGIAFDDMAVVVPAGPSVHSDLVIAALGAAGAPCADLTARPPSATRAGRAAARIASAQATRDAAGSWAARVDAVLEALDPGWEGAQEVEEALEELRVDDMCGPPDGAMFTDAVAIALSDPPGGPAARHRYGAIRAHGGVAVVAAGDVGLSAHDAVVMVGLADFERSHAPAVGPLLDDGERERLNEVLSSDLPLMHRSRESEPADFALGVASARKALVLMRPRAGLDGAAASASPYFRAGAIAVQGSPVGASSLDEAIRVVPAAPFAPEGAGGPGARAWNARRSGDTYTEYDGIVDPADLERLDPAPPGRGLSPTRLETYAACPFRYLVENVYGARRSTVAPEGLSLDPRDRGSLVHAVLESFLGALDGDHPSEAHRSEQLELLDATIDDHFARSSGGWGAVPAVVEQARASIRADLRRWWALEAGDATAEDGHRWRPVALEAAFGRDRGDGGDEVAAVVVETATGPVEVAGRVDRVDISADGTAFRVLDYKTGDVGPGSARAGGRGLQLPVYLRAGAAITDLPLEAGTAEYFQVTRRAGFARTRWDGDAGSGVDGIIADLCASIAAGDFHQEPATCRSAGSCEHAEICGRRVDDLVRARAGDPRTFAEGDT